eukprot:scaffold2293_cov221-Pinguiococcus_pyrenoidosus.AAC.2
MHSSPASVANPVKSLKLFGAKIRKVQLLLLRSRDWSSRKSGVGVGSGDRTSKAGRRLAGYEAT